MGWDSLILCLWRVLATLVAAQAGRRQQASIVNWIPNCGIKSVLSRKVKQVRPPGFSQLGLLRTFRQMGRTGTPSRSAQTCRFSIFPPFPSSPRLSACATALLCGTPSLSLGQSGKQKSQHRRGSFLQGICYLGDEAEEAMVVRPSGGWSWKDQPQTRCSPPLTLSWQESENRSL